MQPSNMPRATEDEGNIVLASHEECRIPQTEAIGKFQAHRGRTKEYHAKRLLQRGRV